MAFEIVDGMTGTKHISSEDLAALNTATVGKADCVLKYGDDFALTMASANSATLGTGVGMVGGRRFWNQAPTSLTIQSGTQGQKRNDLVVARYEKTSAGIESITPVVIKGTPTTGAAADPATTANDLKLWRVPLDGINAGTPVRLFEPVTPLATLGESVSLEQYESNGVTAYKFGRVVVLAIAGSYSIPGPWGNTKLCSLPWKPLNQTNSAPGLQGGGAGVIVQAYDDGTVWLIGKNSSWTDGWLFANLVFVAQE